MALVSERPDRDWLLANGYDERGNRRGVYGSSGTHRPIDTRGDGTQGFKFALASLVVLTGLLTWSWKKLGPIPTIGIVTFLVISLVVISNSPAPRPRNLPNDAEKPYAPSLTTDTPRKSKISTSSHVPTDSGAAPVESNSLPPDTRSMVIGRNEQSPLQSSDTFVTPSNSRINLNINQQKAVVNELEDAAR